MAVELRGSSDEIGHVVGKETLAIETAWILLGEHEGLGDGTLGIDVAEIGPREETVVATGAEHEPAGVGAPVVEGLGVGGVGF